MGNHPRELAAGDRDRTAKARIRDAAIIRFAADGVAATSLRSVASDAGVSPPLVIHHFGSKEGLRTACDRHVVELLWAYQEKLAVEAPGDPLSVLQRTHHELPLLAYLARTIPDASPHVDTLIDEMVADSVRYLAAAEVDGRVKPSAYPRERAVVLVLWQLGALVLHQHATRLLGADLLGEPEGARRWWLPSAEILSKGVIAEALFDRWRESAEAHGSGDGIGAAREAPEGGTA